MLALIRNILFISCKCDCETKEILYLRIINCENGNGDLVDTGFLNNKSTYNLDFAYKQESCSVSICLHIGTLPILTLALGVSKPSLSLVKCTENIGKNGCDNDFILYPDNIFIDSTKHHGKIICWQGVFFVSKFEFKYHHSFFTNFSNGAGSTKTGKDFSSEIIKSTDLHYFRKPIGISGLETNTDVFKFRFVFVWNGFFSNLFRKITFETEQFNFIVHNDGKLVLNKTIKHKRCGRCTVFNQ
ncbi:hypothetical protein CDIK_4216 [Cucumispora dikerogammari]|nr:hypothetical protein CDIK_4216 [Cucumispora dikerogammari]